MKAANAFAFKKCDAPAITMGAGIATALSEAGETKAQVGRGVGTHA